MQYYLLRATTNLGPLRCPIYCYPGQRLSSAVSLVAQERGLILCCDWTAEPISAGEARELYAG